MDLKSLSMSELIALYNQLASTKGVAQVTEFKNLAAARSAIQALELKMTTPDTPVTDPNNQVDPAPIDPNNQVDPAPIDPNVPAAPTSNSEPSKYSTVGKRGPNQGIGEFAKQLLTAGVDTTTVLAQVRAHFPSAKTSASCIAYYKAALKNPNLGKRKAAVDPAALRAKAEEIGRAHV